MRSTEERRKIVWSGPPGPGASRALRHVRGLRLPAAVTAVLVSAAVIRWALGRRGAVPMRVRVSSR
jgi:hypothetical protein